MALEVSVQGRRYPCRVTLGAMVRFKRVSGKDVSEMSQGDVSDVVLFLWCCVASASHADGVDFALDFETFADLLSPGDVSGFVELLRSEGTAAPEGGGDEKKK